jgi:hypothetical protein
MEQALCDKCGKNYSVGEWPFCPHGIPHGMHSFKAYTEYNIDHDPIHITSWGQRRQLMKERNLDYHSRGVGMPGCEV